MSDIKKESGARKTLKLLVMRYRKLNEKEAEDWIDRLIETIKNTKI